MDSNPSPAMLASANESPPLVADGDYSMLDLIFVAIGIAGLAYLAFYYRRR